MCPVRGDTPKSGPSASSSKKLATPPALRGADIQAAWQAPLGASSLRGTGCTFDNGMPLDDEGHPASQLSPMPPQGPPWDFVAGAADDFIFTASPGMNCKVTSIRAAFRFFNDGGESATPRTTFTGVHVTVYPNVGNAPGGFPNFPSGFTGSVVATRFVPASSLQNETLVGNCAAIYVVDIPVSFTVARNTKYWLSIVPEFNAPPQSGWAISTLTHGGADLPAVQGLSGAIAFWAVIDGNTQECPNAPQQFSKKNLSFKITADEVTAATGACCTDSPQSCVDPVSDLDCQGQDQRFAANQSCATMTPPCGSGSGACCQPDGVCQDLNPTQCLLVGGNWYDMPCAMHQCTPANGLCANAIMLTDGVTPFDTIGAVTDGPPDSPTPPCTNVNQDIWFKYQATCTGTVTLSLCAGTNYDSAIAVYQSWACSPLGLRLACDNNSCGGTASIVSFVAMQGDQYLVRVGGSGAAAGTGAITLSCIPAGSGACCFEDHTCAVVPQASCQMAGGMFTADLACSPVTCPPPANDFCANAIGLTDGVHPFDTRGAGVDGPVEGVPCPQIEPDIWYTYTANGDGDLIVSLCEDTNFDASLAVYAGCACVPTLGTRLACDDDGCGIPTGPAKVIVPNVLDGACYLIRVGGTGATGTGKIRIGVIPSGGGACCHGNLSCTLTTSVGCGTAGDRFHVGELCTDTLCSAPLNDLCANAIILSSSTISFDSYGAATDGPMDTPNPPCTLINQDIWYQYTATCNGDLTASLCTGTMYNAALAVYQGCACPPMLGTLLGCNDDACAAGGPASVTVPVMNGQCYLIRVGGNGAETGMGTLSVSCTVSASGCRGDANNDCVINENDIQPFVDMLLDPMLITANGLCRVDMNNNGALNGEDIQPFIDKLLSMPACSCCRGDANLDGVLNGLDAQALIDAIFAPPSACTPAFRAADVNGDDVIDALDAEALATMLLAGASCGP